MPYVSPLPIDFCAATVKASFQSLIHSFVPLFVCLKDKEWRLNRFLSLTKLNSYIRIDSKPGLSEYRSVTPPGTIDRMSG